MVRTRQFLFSSACLLWGLELAAWAEPATPALPQLPVNPSTVGLPIEPALLNVTLPDACRIALSKSPRIGTSLARVRQSLAEAEIAAAPARPHGGITVAGPPPPASLSALRQNLVYTPVRVEIRQVLMDGGKIAAKIDQLKAQADSNSQQAQADWHQLHLDVSLAYLDSLRARANVQVAAESLEISEKQLHMVEKRFQAGDVPKGDILLARVPKAQAELEMTQAKAAARDKEEALNLLVGLPLDTPLQLSPPEQPPPLAQDLQQCMLQAKQQRPAVRALRIGLRAAEHGINAAERDNKPQLSLSAGFYAMSDTSSFIGQTGVAGGLELSWPIFDGGLSGSLTQAAKASRDQAALKLEEFERQSESDVRTAYRAMEVARVAEESSQLQEDQAQDAFRIASAQYRAGMVPFYPMRQAQVDLLKAKINRNGARYDYLATRLKLDFARGQEPQPRLLPPPTP